MEDSNGFYLIAKLKVDIWKLYKWAGWSRLSYLDYFTWLKWKDEVAQSTSSISKDGIMQA